MKHDVNAIAADLEACLCLQTQDALDDAGETIAGLRLALLNAQTERDIAQLEVAGLLGPRLSEEACDLALRDLDELGGLAGYIPIETRVWLEEILNGRDNAAVWLAGQLREAVAG